MKYLYTLLLILIFFSCATQPQRFQKKAELTFASISLTNFYGATDAQYKKLIREIDSTLMYDPNSNTKLLTRHLKNLHEHGLLRKPSINVYIDTDSLITVHLSETAYKKIKHFRYLDLYKEQKKVLLELMMIQKDTHVFYADEIISIEKVNGNSKLNGKTKQFIGN